MPIGSLWLPVVVSAVAVFIASFMIHMMLKYHKADIKSLPNENAVREAIAKGNPSPGLYFTPYCKDHANMKDPAIQKMFETGPVAVVTVMPKGMPVMPKHLSQWFVYSVVVSFVAGYVARHTLHPGDDPMQVMRVTGTVAFAAYSFSHVSDSIWKGQPWGNTARAILDGIIYAVVTGLTFRLLWPAV
ncbi:MAG TPA: hypothetical protein VFE84_10235 [Patescibacteria group bacterium]|jgi:hypothetical protein|nr:hypothetical protein [Patescibacteria group bacterium]